MKWHRNTYYAIVLLFMTMLWMHCANPVAPKGGPKDTEPPMVVEADPLNASVKFDKDRIVLTFNEFVELKDARNQVLFSPPLETAPDYRIRGHSVIIRFEDSLRPNTTYNIFFGNAIVDLTEGNPLSGYRYVFSTGDVIDSLSIQGQVLKAFNLVTEPDVFVMLYLDNNDTLPFDSLPYHVKPAYLGKSTTDGVFSIENLRDLEYKVFALKDVNNNLLYDLPNEEIAFIDTLVSPEYIKKEVQDTIQPDTLHPDSTGLEMELADSLEFQTSLPDSLIADTSLIDTIQAKNFLQLLMFNEIDSVQKVLEAKIHDEYSLLFVYAYPPEKVRLEVINHYMDTLDWKISEMSRAKDTIRLWLKEKPFDTLRFQISDDTLVLDTVDIVFREKEQKAKDEEAETPPLRYKLNATSTIDLDKPLKLTFQYPLLDYDFSSWKLVEKTDTMLTEPVFIDSARRKLQIDYPWKEQTSYELIFADSVLKDLSGAMNDSASIRFNSKSLADYGLLRIRVQMENACERYIIQLMNEDESKIFNERIVDSTSTVIYRFLDPGKYKLKAICDSRPNGRWDTGDYLKGMQAEAVYYFPKIIDLRANWEIEESWDLK